MKLDIDNIVEVVWSAMDKVLDVYLSSNMEVSYKSDNSPVTVADIVSHNEIIQGLTKLFPKIPIISEEDTVDNSHRIESQDAYWLVDPLDGTKDFIKRTGQFCVCIALIENGLPVLGVIGIPTKKKIYYGGKKIGSFMINDRGLLKIHPKAIKNQQALKIYQGSINKETNNYVLKKYPNFSSEKMGSQIKFIEVAKGKGLYPRINSTMKVWDIAAGQAIVEGAKGQVIRPNGGIVKYAPNHLLAGDFIALPAGVHVKN